MIESQKRSVKQATLLDASVKNAITATVCSSNLLAGTNAFHSLLLPWPPNTALSVAVLSMPCASIHNLFESCSLVVLSNVISQQWTSPEIPSVAPSHPVTCPPSRDSAITGHVEGFGVETSYPASTQQIQRVFASIQK